MSDVLRIENYPLLERHLSDLRQCSLDDHDGDSGTYMMDDEADIGAVNFDGVTREFCNAAAENQGVHVEGYPRSVDALYFGGDESSKIALIEFKNGGLSGGNRAVLSSRERKDIKRQLQDAIEGVLRRHIGDIAYNSYSTIEDELTSEAKRIVVEGLGRRPERRRSERGQSREESRTMEAVKTKAVCSALLLQHILDRPASYIKDNVDFILVYNPVANPDEGVSNAPADDRSVPRVDSIERVLPSALSTHAGRPFARFGLKRALWPFFRRVITYTPDELRNEYICAID